MMRHALNSYRRYIIIAVFLLFAADLKADDYLDTCRYIVSRPRITISDLGYATFGEHYVYGLFFEYYEPMISDSLRAEGTYPTYVNNDMYSTWEIRNDSLWLLKVEQIIMVPSDRFPNRYETGSRIIPADSIFEGKGYPIFAHWYSDTILLRTGDCLPDEHLGNNRYFKTQTHIVVRNGCVIDWIHINNEGLDLYRSGEDIDWCGREKAPMVNEGWIDGRLLSYLILNDIIDSNTVFNTRGIIECYRDYEECVLYIPASPLTKEIYYLMEPSPFYDSIEDTAFVEVKGICSDKTDGYMNIRVISLRLLNSNESIHSPMFLMYHWILKLE